MVFGVAKEGKRGKGDGRDMKEVARGKSMGKIMHHEAKKNKYVLNLVNLFFKPLQSLRGRGAEPHIKKSFTPITLMHILDTIKTENHFIKHFFFLAKRKPVLKEKIIHTSCDKNRKSFY